MCVCVCRLGSVCGGVWVFVLSCVRVWRAEEGVWVVVVCVRAGVYGVHVCGVGRGECVGVCVWGGECVCEGVVLCVVCCVCAGV